LPSAIEVIQVPKIEVVQGLLTASFGSTAVGAAPWEHPKYGQRLLVEIVGEANAPIAYPRPPFVLRPFEASDITLSGCCKPFHCLEDTVTRLHVQILKIVNATLGPD